MSLGGGLVAHDAKPARFRQTLIYVRFIVDHGRKYRKRDVFFRTDRQDLLIVGRAVFADFLDRAAVDGVLDLPDAPGRIGSGHGNPVERAHRVDERHGAGGGDHDVLPVLPGHHVRRIGRARHIADPFGKKKPGSVQLSVFVEHVDFGVFVPLRIAEMFDGKQFCIGILFLARARQVCIRDGDPLRFLSLPVVARGEKQRGTHRQNGEEQKCQPSLHVCFSL